MKTSSTLRAILLGASFLAAPWVHGATYYWDQNSTTTGFGTAGGTWDGSGGSTWGTLTGTGAIVSTTTTTSDIINFGTATAGLGSGTITVSGTIDSGDITFGAASGAIVLSGGTINLAAAQTTTVNNTTNTISSILSGAATSFTKAGTGTLILTEANTYTGTTIINRGTLQVGNGTTGSLNGTTGTALTFTGTGTINFNEAAGSTQGMGLLTLTAGDAAIQSTWAGSGTNSLTFSNVTARSAGATANFVQSGGINGTENSIILTQYNGVNTVAGAFIDKGIFFNGSAYAVANATSGYLRGMIYGSDTNTEVTNTITASRHVQLTTTPTAQNSISLLSLNLSGGGVNYTQNASQTLTVPGILKSGGGAVSTISGGTAVTGGTGIELVIRTDTSSDLLSISAPVTGTGALTKSGAGTLTLTSSTNSYSGATFINGGTLEIGGAGRLGSGSHAGAITIASGATFNFNSSAATQTITGLISGEGSITKSGTGILILNNSSNSYTGKTVVNGGILQIGTDYNVGQLSVPGGYTSNPTTGSNIELNGGNLNVFYDFNRSLGTGPGQIQITGGISGFTQRRTDDRPNITFTSASTLITWGSSVFDPSVLVLNGSNAGTAILFNNLLNLNGADRTIATNSATKGATLNNVVSNSIGTGGLIKIGVGTLTLLNGNTYNGATTITEGTLIANSTSALGNSSATNTLIFNGGTLRAGGTITSVAARGVTLTSTGIIDTNSQAVSIAGNITGAGGLTKNSTGTLTLSGNNNYGGVTSVNAGTLAITRQAALYNSNSASWTAANINTKNGTTLALNVDSAGSAGFDATSLDTLLGNISVANTAAEGLQGGTTLTLDTSTASLGTFTQGNAISDSTGTYGGVINLTKLGSGTLIFDKANTYTGITTISAGTLQLNAGGVIAGNITNNSAFAVNSAGSVTQGTNFGLIGGTGSLTQSGAGTLTLNLANTFTGLTTVSAGTLNLSNALALQNSGLLTTGAPNITLSGLSTLTLGGLSGVSGNLATIFSSGFTGTISTLTLNPNSGSVTYGGVIANSSMNLIKSGAGTQILQGVNSYTGTTTIKGGTLTLSTTGTINGSSGIIFSGGALALINTNSTENGYNRLGNAVGITSNGGTLNYTNTTVASVAYAETIGAISLVKGNLDLVMGTNQTNTGNSQTLTISGLGQSSGGTGTIAFSATTTGPQASGNKNMFQVTGAGTTTAGTIIGPWATTGTAANAQTDYAVYSSDYVIPLNATSTTTESWTTSWANTSNYAWGNGTTGLTTGGVRNINTLRHTGGAETLTLGGNLGTYGILNAGSGTLTISANSVTLPTTSAGTLYVSTGNSPMIINSVITDNTGALTLVKSGSAGSITNGNPVIASPLILNGVNTYTGDTYINAGTLQIGTNNVANGAKLGGSGGNYAGNIFIAAGAQLYISTDANQTLSGIISGDGALQKTYTGTLTLSGLNTYTGKTFIQPATTAGAGVLVASSFDYIASGSWANHGLGSSLGAPTTVANGTITIGGNTNNVQGPATLRYASTGAGTATGETTDRIIDFYFGGNTTRTLETNGTGLLKFTSAPISSGGTVGGTIALQGSGDGEFVGGLPFNGAWTLSKSGTGTWTLGGSVGATAAINVTAGTLNLNGPVSGSPPITVSGTGSLNQSTAGVISGVGTFTHTSSGTTVLSGANTYTGATTISAGTLSFADGSLGSIGTINASGGTLQWLTGNTQDISGRLAMTLATTTSLNTNGNNVSFASAIGNSNTSALTKTGLGTLTLLGTNTYTGVTSINAGTLDLGGATANGSLASTILTLGGGAFSYTRTGSATQGFTTTNINSGNASAITVGAGNVLNLGTVVRGTTGSFDFATTGSGTVAALAASNTNGIMAGLTFGNSWAVANGAGVAISALSSYTLSSVALNVAASYTNFNIDVDSNQSPAAVITPNSIRFSSAAANTLTLTGTTNTISSGILVGSGVGNNLSTITGGSLRSAASGNLAIIQNNTDNGLTIGSIIVDNTATSLTKSGAGLVTLTGINTYTGATNVGAGTLTLSGNRTATATGGFNVGYVNGNTATLNVTNGTFTVGSAGSNFLIGGGTNGTGIMNHSGTASLTTAGNQLLIGNGTGTGTYNLSSGTLTTIAGTLGVTVGVNTGVTGTFNLSGTGTLTMPATSTLQITRSDNSAASGITGTFSQTGGTATVGILQMGGSNTTPSNNANQNATLTLTGGTFSTVTFNQLSGGNNSVSTINIGGTAVVTLPNFPTIRGSGATATINFDGGTLRNSATGTFITGMTNAFIRAGGATFDTSLNSTTISQALLTHGSSLGGGLTKIGANTLTLSGVNTYTGTTSISTGTLALSGAGSIASSSLVNVNSTLDVTAVTGNFTMGASQTFGGSGTILATGKTVVMNGTLSPGNSPGTLTQDGGTLQLGANGNTNWQIHNANGVAGTGYDTINLINGATLDLSLLSVGNEYNINLWSLSGIGPDVNGDAINFDNTQNYAWTLFSTGTAITGFNANLFDINIAAINGTNGFTNLLGGGSFSVGLGDSNTDIMLNFTAIPEPRAALLCCLGVLLLLRRRR